MFARKISLLDWVTHFFDVEYVNEVGEGVEDGVLSIFS